MIHKQSALIWSELMEGIGVNFKVGKGFSDKLR